MFLALWLLQEAQEGAVGANTTFLRVIAGVLALLIIVVILVRRKRKASKEDWT
jgi:LPXTG-motif cell wall-anchored protein